MKAIHFLMLILLPMWFVFCYFENKKTILSEAEPLRVCNHCMLCALKQLQHEKTFLIQMPLHHTNHCRGKHHNWPWRPLPHTRNKMFKKYTTTPVGKGMQRGDCVERNAERGLWGKECREGTVWKGMQKGMENDHTIQTSVKASSCT